MKYWTKDTIFGPLCSVRKISLTSCAFKLAFHFSVVRYSEHVGFKPCYAQTSPVFLLLGNLLSSTLIYWVCKGVCIGLVPYFCLRSAWHRQVIAAIFVSVSLLFEPARSFCLAWQEAPLMRAGLLQLCEAACFHACIISQPAVLLMRAGLSFARRPVAALRSCVPPQSLLLY